MQASLIWAAGSLELEQFSREGKTDQQLRLTLKDWGFLPAMQKHGGEPREYASIINGDREPLPGEIRQNIFPVLPEYIWQHRAKAKT